MKRDMDLARKILLMIEECPEASFEQPMNNADDEGDEDEDGSRFRVEDCKPDLASYHVKLLAEAGLIEARDASTMSGDDWWPVSLTWAGHEFLDASREPGRWEKAKKLVMDKTGSLSFEVLKAVLRDQMMGMLG